METNNNKRDLLCFRTPRPLAGDINSLMYLLTKYELLRCSKLTIKYDAEDGSDHDPIC